MTIEINFPQNVIEQNYDIDGVKVRVTKNRDEYQIWIEDESNRFIQSKLPKEYKFYYPNNLITFDDRVKWKRWWSNGYAQKHRKEGYFKNETTMNFGQIQACVEAVENGVNRLKELQKPEIIKIGNVTIEKKRIDSNHSTLTIDGLLGASRYPTKIENGVLAWKLDDESFDLYDENGQNIIINGTWVLPLKDLKCTNADANKVIETITKSEEKLARYYWEEDNKDIKEHVFELKDKAICVKIVPEYDIPFSINGVLPTFKGYKLYINVPKSFRDTLISVKSVYCNVEYLNGDKKNIPIIFRKAHYDWDWALITSGVDDVLSIAFNNGDLFDKDIAERMFCYIRAYLQTWCKKEDEVIKVGDVVENKYGYKTVVVCIDTDEAWVKHCDGTHLTYNIKDLIKVK